MARFAVAATLLVSVLAAEALVALKQPLNDAELRATGDTGYPCPASGVMIDTCDWYTSFVRKNPAPPKSMKEPFIHGGTKEWHGPDEELKTACEANYNTICIQKNPLCDEYFDKC